ncbi:MAG TPA: hypothetical protein VG934_02665 [Candidatus Paceibacterota bacterium]|nr:hypothetical protein [Candidatus Paceibacterota bacterium]
MANKSNGMGMSVGVGAGLAAVAATGAAAYWLYGAKHSTQHRKMAKSWMLKARAEVLDAVEKLNDIDKAQYLALAEQVVQNYGSKAGASAQQMSHMMKDFKSAWAHMQAAQKGATKGASKAKRAARKAATASKRR